MVISNNVSVAANALSANVLAGDLYEFLPTRGVISFYATGSAAGLLATLLIGGINYCDNSVIPPTNRFPIRPDDGMTQAGGQRGERLFLTFLNSTAGALTANWLLDIQPR